MNFVFLDKRNVMVVVNLLGLLNCFIGIKDRKCFFVLLFMGVFCWNSLVLVGLGVIEFMVILV